MIYTALILVVGLLSISVIPFVASGKKGIIAMLGIIANAVLSSILAVSALSNGLLEYNFYGGAVLGDIIVRIDSLSAWFLILMNFTAVTSVVYGNQYMKAYQEERNKLSLHFICMVLNHWAMIGVYTFQNSLAFLCVWEIMTVAAFIMVIFESNKMETLRAGINYFIQSHICILFLTLGFIWVNFKTGSYDFQSIVQYTSQINPAFSIVLFFCFFMGFAFKAGFVPFHTWLPYAHPAAPSHVSGLMSGVIIKTGIYGILRMLLLIQVDYVLVGTVILIISLISGIYGVMLAILQHNLKRLLAYHSIENIGIIGIGIGIGAIGKGLENQFLEFAGFAGALLHTLNHSLFKSLLFYAAGSVYQAIHILNVERMGGVIRKMPQTTLLFLLASIAICGIPPFNGFISEFLIYAGLFDAVNNQYLSYSILFILSIFSLVLIGGLALFCFTKAFGIAFLGQARSRFPEEMKEAEGSKLLPKYAIGVFIIIIGLFPQLFISIVSKPVSLFISSENLQVTSYMITSMQKVGFASWGLILLITAIYFIKKSVSGKVRVSVGPTWGCGYAALSPKIQYTSGSFSRSYRNLIKPLLRVVKHDTRISSIVPEKAHVETHVFDKIEFAFVEIPVRNIKNFIGKFKFLQNGSVQFYVLYGVVFIFIAITIPFLINATSYLINIFKQL